MKFYTILLAALAGVAAAEHGNNTDGTCSTCGSKMSVDIASWCSKYTGWSQDCCKCIVRAESGGNAHACEKSLFSTEVGLWQIPSSRWSSCNGGSAPCSPSANLYCAKSMFGDGGNTWKRWSTCSTCGCCSKS